jgi:23S rRNA (guanosine2251-2'-O)-methyltransferase
MGSEDRGVNPSVLKIVEKSKLPMFGTIGSLNVSWLVVLLYEAVRQRN